MLQGLLDPTNDSDFVWGDSAYSGFHFDEFLKAAGFHSRIHEKGTRNCPLTDGGKARNSLTSKIYSRVEHIYSKIRITLKAKHTILMVMSLTKTW